MSMKRHIASEVHLEDGPEGTLVLVMLLGDGVTVAIPLGIDGVEALHDDLCRWLGAEEDKANRRIH